MAACRSYLHGALHVFLSFDIGKVEFGVCLLFIKLFAGVDDGGLVAVVAVEKLDDIAEVVHAVHFELVDHGCLAHIIFGHNESAELFLAGLYGHGKGATHWL